MQTDEQEMRDTEREHRTVTVAVNGRPVELKKEKMSGLEIKQAAMAQGVPIELTFVLQLELPNGNSKIIGDSDLVKINKHDRFTAIAADDNS